MTYLLDVFQARVCRVSCNVCDNSGNSPSNVSREPEDISCCVKIICNNQKIFEQHQPEIMILSPISGATWRATTSQTPEPWDTWLARGLAEVDTCPLSPHFG